MPRTGYTRSSALGIRIDNLRPSYSPSDTINGDVFSEEPPNNHIAQHSVVRLKFFGRTKAKRVKHTFNGDIIDRSSVVLFSEQRNLHEGPLDESGPNTWSFSVTIPKTSSPGLARRGDAFEEEDDFLSTSDPSTKHETDVNKHPLPSVMYYASEGSWSGITVEAYVEYSLIAEYGDVTASLTLNVSSPAVQISPR